MNKAVEERWQKFEALGERSVRQNLASHAYGEENAKLAEAWLQQKELQAAQESERRAEASNREQILIARSAKNAAWIAAIAAIVAAIAAAIATYLSVSRPY